MTWFPDTAELALHISVLPDRIVRGIVTAFETLVVDSGDRDARITFGARVLISAQLMLLRIICMPVTERFLRCKWCSTEVTECFYSCVVLLSSYTLDCTHSNSIKWVMHVTGGEYNTPSTRRIAAGVFHVLEEFGYVVWPIRSMYAEAAQKPDCCDMDPVGTCIDDPEVGQDWRRAVSRVPWQTIKGSPKTRNAEWDALFAMERRFFDIFSMPRNSEVRDTAFLRQTMTESLRTRASALHALHTPQQLKQPRITHLEVTAPTLCLSPALTTSSDLSAVEEPLPILYLQRCPPRPQPKSLPLVCGKRKRSSPVLRHARSAGRPSPSYQGSQKGRRLRIDGTPPTVLQPLRVL